MLKFSFLVFIFNISCNSIKPYQGYEPSRFNSRKITQDKKSAKIKFVNFSRTREIEMIIKWKPSPDELYTEIGPVWNILIQEEAKLVDLSRYLDFSFMEDVDLKNITIKSVSPYNYVISIPYGVGENLAYPSRISFDGKVAKWISFDEVSAMSKTAD
jgi:hypothetical protein